MIDLIGKVVGLLTSWIPKKPEYYRNKISEIKYEMDNLTKLEANNDRVNRYKYLAGKLRVYESKLQNLAKT